MIKAQTVEAIFQRKHSLNFVCLNHSEQQVTNYDRLLTFADLFARKVLALIDGRERSACRPDVIGIGADQLVIGALLLNVRCPTAYPGQYEDRSKQRSWDTHEVIGRS